MLNGLPNRAPIASEYPCTFPHDSTKSSPATLCQSLVFLRETRLIIARRLRKGNLEAIAAHSQDGSRNGISIASFPCDSFESMCSDTCPLVVGFRVKNISISLVALLLGSPGTSGDRLCLRSLSAMTRVSRGLWCCTFARQCSGRVSLCAVPVSSRFECSAVTQLPSPMLALPRKVAMLWSTPSVCTPSGAGSPRMSGVVTVRALNTVQIHLLSE